jgi:hypothetical protein
MKSNKGVGSVQDGELFVFLNDSVWSVRLFGCNPEGTPLNCVDFKLIQITTGARCQQMLDDERYQLDAQKYLLS